MKRLYLKQYYNATYLGEEKTPDQDKYLYRVEKTFNTIDPAIGEELSPAEAKRYCNSEKWAVTITR